MERTTTRGASLGEIEATYRAMATRFLRLAQAVVGDEEDARDVVQDAMARAIRQRHDFRGDGPLAAWLWKAVLNTARTKRRATLVKPEGQLFPSEPSTGRDEQRDVMLVRAAVLRLPERERLVLFLRYYADLDYRGIARVLDISPGTVGPTLAHAQESLRTLLGGLDRD